MNFTLGLLLLFCNIAWAINPAVGKILVNEIGPGLTAWSKYAGTFVFLMLYLATKARRAHVATSAWTPLKSKNNFFLLLLMGASTFFIAPLTQMTGLQSSSATSNSILVAMEPLITLFFAWIILKSKPATGESLCLALALIGFALTAHFSWSGTEGLSFNRGDLLILAAIACEALYAVLIQKLKKVPAEIILTASIGVGFLFLTIAVLPGADLSRLLNLKGSALLALLWSATLGGALPYLVWTHVIKKGIPLAVLVSSLFWQPLLGSVAGNLIHGEVITGYQIMGGLFIISAVMLQTYMERRRQERAVKGISAVLA